MALVVKDWQDSPSTSTPLSAAALEDLETRLGAYTDRFAATYQTSLPGSPADGDTIAYAADATNGVIWHLRYRSGASGSYKWEFIGGPPMFHNIVTAETQTATGAWGDLSTVGPTVTVPLAGDYMAACSCGGVNTFAGANTVYIGMAQGAGTPAQDTATASAGASYQLHLQHARPFTALSASTEIRVRYFSVSNGHTFRYRTLTVTPIRVG